ncbi:hypothetical protein [Allocoleopsis sp.]|uniref:hypothetical protein n=1 Tax=Allocoleopsis sp. TaxID=3088169 RepID=UPI002FD0E02A
MSRNDEKPSKLPLIIAITSLALAFFALGVAVSLSVPTLRKSSSFTPTTPVVPFAPSRTQASPTSAPASKPKTVRSPLALPSGRSQKSGHDVRSPAPTPTSATSPSATPENNTNGLNEDRN